METFSIDSKNHQFDLYLNMIGGHSFIINIGEGKILKSATQNEINFYKFYKNFNFDIYNLFPKYFGKIKKEQEEYKIIKRFYSECDTVFRSFLSNFNFDNFNINLEDDEEFNIKLENILKTTEKNENQNPQTNFLSLEKLREQLNTMKLESPDKLKWILFWFVKWGNSFLKYDYIILEDLSFNMEHPAILDLKLGFNNKYNPKRGHSKHMPDSLYNSGLRIMGIQNYSYLNQIRFKNRYESKLINTSNLNKEVINFFQYGNVKLSKLINIVISELEKINRQMVLFDYSEIPYSSLLIVYDCDFFLECERNNELTLEEDKIKGEVNDHCSSNELEEEKLENFLWTDKLNIKIIDFAYFKDVNLKNFTEEERKSTENKNITNAIENLINFLKNSV